jgi:hypothetical protein
MWSKDMVPFYEALAWIIFWGVLIFKFRNSFLKIIDAIIKRIESGSKVIVGPMTLGEPPKTLSEEGPDSVVISDKGKEPTLPVETTTKTINQKYDELKKGYFLLHAAEVIKARTIPNSGRYKVRLWIESYEDKKLDEIVKVTYKLWDDFERPVITTASKETNFDLWLNLYGEFPVLAYVERKNSPPIWIERYIELPGRPPD